MSRKPNRSMIPIPDTNDEVSLKITFDEIIKRIDEIYGKRGKFDLRNFRKEAVSVFEEVDRLKKSLEELKTTVAKLSDTVDKALQDIDLLMNLKDDLKNVALLNYTALSMPATYDQATEQQLANDVKTIADKVDEILNIIKGY